jgi:hypothetical protein
VRLMDENQEELEVHFQQLREELDQNDLQAFRDHFCWKCTSNSSWFSSINLTYLVFNELFFSMKKIVRFSFRIPFC